MTKNGPTESTLTVDDSKGQARLNAFSKYLCKKLLAKLLINDQRLAPELEQFQAAVLFADISGFTQLTESLSSQYGDGHAVGAEHLTLMLSEYFDSLIEVVFAHYGDVIKFAGDALLILFPHEDADVAFQRACSCGVAMQAAAARIAESIASEHDVDLSLKVAISVGDVTGLVLGGIFNRWEYAITGEAIIEVGRLGGVADPGDVIADDKTLKRMGKKALHGLHRIAKMPGISNLKKVPAWDLQFAANPLIPHLEMESKMRSFIPAAVASRIAAGQTNSLLLGELRRVTVLFINLPQFNTELALEQAQILVSTIQETCYAQRGSIDKLSCDDKGVSVIAGFGLPPMSEEDDALRAVRAALTMTKKLRGLGLEISIGVATGPVYCGTLGSRFRQEYTLMGDVVNTAARLMQNEEFDILCDHNTHIKSVNAIEFGTAISLSLKGKQNTVHAYSPVAIKGKQNQQLSDIIGRVDEQQQIISWFDQVQQSQQQAGLVIEGDPGIGKSTLIRSLLNHLKNKNNILLHSSANAVTSTLYGIWQNLLLQVLGLSDSNNQDKTLLHLQQYLTKYQLNDAVEPMLPLLNHILGLALEATELTLQMDNEVKAQNTRRLILQLLKPLIETDTLVIIIDDAHWMDSASWQLLLQLRQELPNSFCVLLNRRMSELNAASYQQILALEKTKLVKLTHFDSQQTLDFVKHKLDISELPDNIAELITARAEGHPLFCEELLKDLSDRNIINVSNGVCHVDNSIDLSKDLQLPATIEGAITARLDRLELSQQLIIKVASIIGRSFSVAALADIYPVPEDAHSLGDKLEYLCDLGLMQKNPNTSLPGYQFSQTTLQRIAYDLMLISQRKQLHEKVALWIEQQHQHDLSESYLTLAQHYNKAERYNKAIKYYDLAAQQALDAYANNEAIQYVQKSKDLAVKADLGLAPATSVRWYNMLGQAYLYLGNMQQAEACSLQILRMFKHPVPKTKSGLLLATAGQFIRQIRHRYLPITLPRLSARQQTQAGQAGAAAERLFMIYYFSENAIGLVYSAISAINLSERESKMTRVLAKSYTNFTGALAVIPLIGFADRYAKRAEYVAQQVDDGPTSAWLHLVFATYRAGLGRWFDVEQHALSAMHHAQDLGDQRRWEEAASIYSTSGILNGKIENSQEPHNTYQKLYQSGLTRSVIQVQAWGLKYQTVVALVQGQQQLAQQSATNLQQLVQEDSALIDPTTILEAYACFAKIALLQKDYGLCGDWIKRGLNLFSGKHRSTRFALVSGSYFLAEAALRLYSIKGNADQGIHQQNAKQCIKIVGNCQAIFPIAKSRFRLLQGWFEQLKGRPKKAQHYWLSALAPAKQYGMHFDSLLCSLALQDQGATSAEMLSQQDIDQQLKSMSITAPQYLRQWDQKLIG